MNNQKVYFSGIKEIIADAINKSCEEILVAVAWFTDTTLKDALLGALQRGVKISIIIYDDKINDKSFFETLYYQGAKIGLAKKLMHNKFCVIDRDTVINGSYNWTIKAKSNDENIQVTSNNSYLANQFIEQFGLLHNSCKTIDEFFQYGFKVFENEENKILREFEEQRYSEKYPFFINWKGYEVNEFQNKFLGKALHFNRQHADLISFEVPLYKYRLENGFYLMRNEDDELNFFRLRHYLSNNFELKKIEKKLGKRFLEPLYFWKIINFKNISKETIPSTNAYHIVEEFKDTFISIPKSPFLKSYSEKKEARTVYKIDSKGQLLGDKITFQSKLPNGYYYKRDSKSSKTDPDPKPYIYNSTLEKKELDCFAVDKIFDKIGLVTYILNNERERIGYGLTTFSGKQLLPPQFESYSVTEDCNKIEFLEKPILFSLKSDWNKFLLFDKNQHLLLNEIPLLKKSYDSKKGILSTEAINWPEKVHDCVFLSEKKGIFKEFYKALVESMSWNRVLLRDWLISYKTEFLKLSQIEGNLEKENISILLEQHRKLNEENKAKEIQAKKNAESCYVATMVYEDVNHPKVQTLRNYRDTCLRKNLFGRIFIRIYYTLSPNLVKFAKNHKFLQSLLRSLVIKIVYFVEKIELKA